MENYDIIIEGGQSNAEGCGKGPVTKEYIPTDKICYLNVQTTREKLESGKLAVSYPNAPFTVTVAKERISEGDTCGDLALTFAQKYIEDGKLEEGRKLLIIRSAVGATGFKHEHWGIGKPLHENMLKMTDHALTLGGENRIVAFLWHQGEHDAVWGSDPKDFRKHMEDTINAVRTRYLAPSLPFICADFVQHWKMENLKSCVPIIAQLKEICEKIDCACFVSSVGLQSNDRSWGNGDNIHFCKQALHELGERYYLAYKHILNKK